MIIFNFIIIFMMTEIQIKKITCTGSGVASRFQEIPKKQFGKLTIERKVDPGVHATVETVQKGQNCENWTCKKIYLINKCAG